MEKNLATKFIFISGGVISGVGKGVATSSIALLLKSRGFKVTAIKADPYLNVDAGTLNPVEHGEVFVLDDGMECDQDLGHIPSHHPIQKLHRVRLDLRSLHLHLNKGLLLLLLL